MAKLGTDIIWRAVRTREFETPTDSMEPVYREHHLALRADGKVLEKRVVGFYSIFDDDTVKRHDYGWKLAKGKLKAGMDNFDIAQEALNKVGYIVTCG